MKKGFMVLLIILLTLTIAVTSARLFFDEPEYVEKASATDDITLCDNINTVQVRDFCKNRYYYNKALEDSDMDLCYKINEQTIRKHCLEDFN